MSMTGVGHEVALPYFYCTFTCVLCTLWATLRYELYPDIEVTVDNGNLLSYNKHR
jgi:hypothetical protein